MPRSKSRGNKRHRHHHDHHHDNHSHDNHHHHHDNHHHHHHDNHHHNSCCGQNNTCNYQPTTTSTTLCDQETTTTTCNQETTTTTCNQDSHICEEKRAIGKFVCSSDGKKGFMIYYNNEKKGEFIGVMHKVGRVPRKKLHKDKYYCVLYEIKECHGDNIILINKLKEVDLICKKGKVEKCETPDGDKWIIVTKHNKYIVQNDNNLCNYKECKNIVFRGVGLVCVGLCKYHIHLDDIKCKKC